jgi:hypothetical protein
MTNHQDTRREKANPFAKNTYRVLNEPYKLLGILDWRYGFCAAVPAVFFGLVAHSVMAGLIAFGLLAWQAWRIAEDDPNWPLVWFTTLFDKHHAGGFAAEQNREGK